MDDPRPEELRRLGPARAVPPPAVVGLDATGTITVWSEGATQLTGLSTPEALGRPFRDLFVDAAPRGRGADDLVDTVGRVRLREGGEQAVTLMTLPVSSPTDSLTVICLVQASDGCHSTDATDGSFTDQVRDYAIFALDEQGRVRTWNEGARRLKGYTHDEIAGEHLSRFYTAPDREAGVPEQLLARARTAGAAHHTGWRVRKDGTLFWGDVTITSLWSDGHLTGYAKVTKDLSEQKAVEAAHNSFVEALGHDLRTPITALRGFLEIAKDAPDASRREWLERAENNLERLEQMMDELVAGAVVGGRERTFELTGVDVRVVLERALESITPPDAVARVVGPDRPALVLADPEALRRMLINLVSNALAYSPSDAPVRVDAVTVRGRVRVTVSDQGRGIHPDDIDAIFAAGTRGRLADPDDGGTGVGLASVRALAKRQDGRVWLSSVVDQGTVVTIELPAPSPGLSSDRAAGRRT